MNHRRRASIHTALALLCLAHACAADHPVWCVGESTKVMPGDPPQARNLIWDGSSHTVSIASARNEYVGFQIAIRAAKEELQNVTVVASDLVGPGKAVIPAANIDLFVEHYLNVTVSSRSSPTQLFRGCTAGEHPTQLVPFAARKYGAPFDIATGRNQPVWVDVYVPEDAAPGAYTGTCTVMSGDKKLSEVAVSLTVWTFTLPHETHFSSYLYTGPENLRWGHHLAKNWDDPANFKLYDAYFQMAHQHRLNFTLVAGDGLDEATNTFHKYYDGTGFTQRVGKGVGQTLALITPSGANEEAVKASARRIVEATASTSLKATIISYIWDEPHSDADFAESKRRCTWVHEAVGTKLKTFIATPQWQRYDAGDVDIFSEPSAEDVPKIVARGGTVWSVNSGYAAGPFIDSPGFGGRSIALMTWKMQLGGWQFWDACYWVDKQCLRKAGFSYQAANKNPDAWLTNTWKEPLTFDETRKPGYPVRDAIRINGDGVVFYPGYEAGIDGPIAGFQTKSLRRGAQDYEYLWLLRERKQEQAAAAILDTLCPGPGSWNEDPESWDKARLAWAAMLDK